MEKTLQTGTKKLKTLSFSFAGFYSLKYQKITFILKGKWSARKLFSVLAKPEMFSYNQS